MLLCSIHPGASRVCTETCQLRKDPIEVEVTQEHHGVLLGLLSQFVYV